MQAFKIQDYHKDCYSNKNIFIKSPVKTQSPKIELLYNGIFYNVPLVKTNNMQKKNSIVVNKPVYYAQQKIV